MCEAFTEYGKLQEKHTEEQIYGIMTYHKGFHV